MLPEQILYLGIFFNLIGEFLYLKSIIYGNTKPNLISWFFWMLAPFIGVFFQIKAGAGLIIIPTFMAGFGPLLVILLSLFKKNAYWKLTSFDIYCGILAGLALGLYVLTHNLSISILFAILADFIGAIPTITKSWKFPETESSHIYSWCIIPNILVLFVVKDWFFPIYSFSIYFILVNLAILFAIHRKKVISIFS